MIKSFDPHQQCNNIILERKEEVWDSLWAICVIGYALSSPISIFFIGVLIHLISISILLDNYVIINSKSDMTQKYISFHPQPQRKNSKTTFPFELIYLLILSYVHYQKHKEIPYWTFLTEPGEYKEQVITREN